MILWLFCSWHLFCRPLLYSVAHQGITNPEIKKSSITTLANVSTYCGAIMTLTNESSTPAESIAVPAAPALCCAACQPGMPQHAQRDSSLPARWHLLTQASAVPASTPAHTYIHLQCRTPAGTIREAHAQDMTLAIFSCTSATWLQL